MSKINKILFLVLIITAFFIMIILVGKNNKKGAFASRENEGGSVTVTVKPRALKVGEKPAFEIEFNTHSVGLNFDISQSAILVDDKGAAVSLSQWNGSKPGGHHRRGALTFNEPLS